jgi:hypothetical protein
VDYLSNRNLLFDFKHGDDDTPISLVRDIVKRFSSGDPPKVCDQHHRSAISTITGEIAQFSAAFATPLLT